MHAMMKFSKYGCWTRWRNAVASSFSRYSASILDIAAAVSELVTASVLKPMVAAASASTSFVSATTRSSSWFTSPSVAQITDVNS